jgi:hypothetical protein
MAISNRPRLGWGVLGASLEEQDDNHRACGYDQTAYFHPHHFKKIAAITLLHVGQIGYRLGLRPGNSVP